MKPNNNNRKTISSKFIVGSAISIVLLTATNTTIANEIPKTTKMSANTNKVQCAGVVKAGLNDCASAEHACAGLNTDDGYQSDWLWLPAGTCEKIKKGHIITTVK